MADPDAPDSGAQRPDPRLIELIAADRSLPFDAAEIRVSWQVQVRHRGELEHLRGVSLSYLPDYIEPATALQWIENGGEIR